MQAKYILLGFLALMMVGCISYTEPQKSSSNNSNVELVRQNTALALEQCGRGNVKEVTITGFACFDK